MQPTEDSWGAQELHVVAGSMVLVTAAGQEPAIGRV